MRLAGGVPCVAYVAYLYLYVASQSRLFKSFFLARCCFALPCRRPSSFRVSNRDRAHHCTVPVTVTVTHARVRNRARDRYCG